MTDCDEQIVTNQLQSAHIADSARLILSVPLLATACRTIIMGALRQCGQFEHSLGRAARLWSVGVGVGPCPFRDEVGDQHGCCSGTRDRQPTAAGPRPDAADQWAIRGTFCR
jgi:hypothetical protein